MESDSEMGPLITAESRDRVVGYIDGAPNEGWSAVDGITNLNAGRSTIHTIALGMGGSASEIMQGIAEKNGGRYGSR